MIMKLKERKKKWGWYKHPPPRYKTRPHFRHLQKWINEKRNVG
jgi:hypothetical protein